MKKARISAGLSAYRQIQLTIKFIKPNQSPKVSADPDDYEFEDEEYENEDIPEQDEMKEDQN